jgi:transglutaminase-like putative cysteine protease
MPHVPRRGRDVRLPVPLPPAAYRVGSVLVVLAWLGQMGVLVQQAYLRDVPSTLAGDLGRYGSSAQWKGIYYRGEKIGFSVGQTSAVEGGYEIQEDGQLQMMLLGAGTPARIRTNARVDTAFNLRSFSFSLDPGTGPIEVRGRLEGARLFLDVKTSRGTRSEVRELPEPPALALNLARRLAAAGLVPGTRLEVPVFDPATLRNAPMAVEVGPREVVRVMRRPTPAFRVTMSLAGVTSTSWVTDVGEVVREESPTGLMVVRETRDTATALAVPGQVQTDLLAAAAIAPDAAGPRIDDPMQVELLRLRLEGLDASALASPELQGAGQSVSADVFELRDARTLTPGPADPDARRYLSPEPLLESDAPEIVAEARKATSGASGTRARAERLVRYVSALLEKKPTVSLPSAREVLRTRVGDCNEHTALYVAMARSLDIPSRIAVGLVHLHGAFYYHAWPEVYLEGPPGRGLWLPVDPTLDQFPADATHVRLARGGLDRQAAILPLMGRARMKVLEVQVKAGSTPVLVGAAATRSAPRLLDIDIPRRDGSGRGCWSRPGRRESR